jgi:hypothetical protein
MNGDEARARLSARVGSEINAKQKPNQIVF